MKKILAFLKMFVVICVLLDGAILFALARVLPISWRGDRLFMWVPTWMARAFVWVMELDVRYENEDRLTKYDGFVFPNHGSYLDIVVLQSIRPMRYVAYAGVQNLPIVGWMAKSMKTVFVQRSNKASREEARGMIAELERGAPVVLFPEGKVTGTAELDIFRHGAFHLAIEKGFDIVPVGIAYGDYEVATHYGVMFAAAAWRLAQNRKQVVDVVVLDVIDVRLEDDVEALTERVKGEIETVLNLTTETQS